MSEPPFLEQVWLVESDTGCEDREALTVPVDIGLDVDELSFGTAGNRVVVKAGLSFGLHPKGSNESIADLAATFRLVYRMAPLAGLDEQRRFASERALPDVWPVWRTWLHETLALMGLGPTPLPAQIPSRLIFEGHEAFDLALQVQESLPRKGRRKA